MLEKIVNLIEKKGGIVIEGKTIIKSKKELEIYLKNTFRDFSGLEDEMCQ